MLEIVRSSSAIADLKGIWRYIAENNPVAADAFIKRLQVRVHLLARMPELGTIVPDLGPGLRYFTVGDYVIYYRVSGNMLSIARILHGARDLSGLFDEFG